jgi:tetratricopeptide (TPR) repeat protein
MRAYVFTDPAITRHAGRFVWLELDTEKAKNAEIKKRLGVAALPTSFVLDPADERVALRWVGGFTVAQLDRLLDDGAAAVSGVPGRGAADSALARADRLYAAGDNAAAAAEYERALASAPEGWPSYTRAADAALFALSSADSFEAATRLAHVAFPRVARLPSAASVAASGLEAALELPRTHPLRRALVAEFEQDARAVLADSTLPIAADDRSGLYIDLMDARKERMDVAGTRELAGQWAAFLEREAAAATTPEQRAVFDSHRLSAYLELGQPERAIPMLQASERDLPGDYNPPARLAVAYRALGRWDDALAASDRALEKAYGPRKLALLATRSDIYAGKGDKTSARKTLEQAIALAESLPPGQQSPGMMASLNKKLEALKPF